jgi:hypothetical protein
MMAIQQMAQAQDATAKKAMMSMQKVQMEGEQRAAAQAAQMQSGVQDIANQVAGGMEKMQAKRERKEAEVEGMRQSQDMAKFQAQLQQEAVAESQRIGTLLKNSRDASMTAVTVWNEKKDSMRDNISTAWASYRQMHKDGTFRDIPNGAAISDEVFKNLKNAEATHIDQFDPAFLTRATKLLSTAERDIVEGRDPMDLAALYDSPNTSLYRDIEGGDGPLPEISGQMRMELDARGGWPANGLMSMQADDPVQKHVRIATPDVMAQVLMMDADRAKLITEEAREAFSRSDLRIRRDTLDLLNKDFEAHKQVSTMHFNRSVPSITEGSRLFWNDPRSSKFDDIGENFGMQLMATMLGEQAGQDMPELIQGIRDRSVTFDTASELTAAMHVESAAAALEHRLHQVLTVANGASLGADKDGKAHTMMSDLTKQFASTPAGQQQLKAQLPAGSFDNKGVLTESGLASAQFVMQNQLQAASAWLGETRESAKQMSSYKEFSKVLGTQSRLAEIATFGWLNDHADDADKAAAMLRSEDDAASVARAKDVAGQMSGAELRERAGAGADWTMGGVSKLKFEAAPEVKRSHSMIENFLAYTNHFHPHEVPIIAHFLSGGQVDLTDGNVPKFNAATQNAAEINEYIALADSANKARRELNKQAKKASDSGTPWTPQQGLMAKNMVDTHQAKFAAQAKRYRNQPRGLVRQGFRNLGLGFETIASGLSTMASNVSASFDRGLARLGDATVGEMGGGMADVQNPPQVPPGTGVEP